MTRLKRGKPQLPFDLQFFFVSRTNSFGLVMTFSITFQSALQRSMYAGESLIWEKSVQGFDRYFSEFRDREAKCKQSDSPEMNAQISAKFSKECNLISDDIQLRLCI